LIFFVSLLYVALDENDFNSRRRAVQFAKLSTISTDLSEGKNDFILLHFFLKKCWVVVYSIRNKRWFQIFQIFTYW